ncbi:MAG: hypothetical protein HYZ54_12410 [Ignavibacteriae bacterium]|nr:hypothetical protein [Ignavibacteriota bacterium]
MKKNKFKIVLNYYEDIEESKQDILAWRDPSEFAFNLASNEQKEILKEIRVIEIASESQQFLPDNADVNYSNIIKILENIVSHGKYLWTSIFSEYSAELKSRIRSYKGQVKRKINEKLKYIELEIDKPNNYTHFMSAVLLETDKVGFMFEGGNSIIAGNFQLYSSIPWKNFEEFLLAIEENYINYYNETLAIINYLSLVTSKCRDDTIIMRISGDGDERITLQLFTHESNLEVVKNLVEASYQKFQSEYEL